MDRFNHDGNTVEVIEGRNIILNVGAAGKCEPHHVRQVIDDIMKITPKFKGKWGYIGDPRKMEAILSKETSAEFVNLHKTCEQNGCVGMAMVMGKKVAVKQAASHHAREANKQMQTENFATLEDALEWLKSLGV